MTYRPWAKAVRKEWFPKEGPCIIQRDLPPHKPAVLKPHLKKCPTVKIMRLCGKKDNNVQRRPRIVGRHDQRKGIGSEKQDSLKEEDHQKAGQTFDLLDFRYTEPEPADKLGDQKLLLLLDKENHQPVSKQYSTRIISLILLVAYPKETSSVSRVRKELAYNIKLP